MGFLSIALVRSLKNRNSRDTRILGGTYFSDFIGALLASFTFYYISLRNSQVVVWVFRGDISSFAFHVLANLFYGHSQLSRVESILDNCQPMELIRKGSSWGLDGAHLFLARGWWGRRCFFLSLDKSK